MMAMARRKRPLKSIEKKSHLLCEDDTPRVCGANAATEATRTRSKRTVFMVVMR
jgi:hypothetical protein